ncbi:polysaccharide biosynthesis C-terminal domain-containing protein [Nocardioides sp.]|uniref:lipopolysaccharide biosynthesis protein n=1 Tax=Nocardioides sp. TaxID=35761 RepID=UPI003D1527A2
MSDNTELRRLARGGVGGLMAAAVSGLGGLVFITIAARSFSKADVGTTFALTSLFLIAVAVVTLGTDVGIVRFLAVKRAQGRDDHLSAVMAVTLGPVILLSIATASALWFTLPLVFSTEKTDMARLLAVFLPMAAISNLSLAGTRGLGTVRPTVTIDGLLRQGLQPLLALVVAWQASDPFWLVAAWVTPYAVSAVAGWMAYVRMCRKVKVAPITAPWSPSTQGVWAEVWRFHAPRSVTQIAQIGIRRADIPLVTAIAGPAAAGVYTAASRFVAAGLQAIRGTQQMVGPQMARLVGAGRLEEAGTALRTATTWNVLVAWPLYLTCAAMPDLVLSLFGPNYSSGKPVVVILALAMLIGTAAGPVDIALLMLGRSTQSLANNMAALVTNLALNLLLIPIMGITGAATAWAASILVSNALPTWQIRKVLGNPWDRATLFAVGATLVPFGALPLAGRLAGLDTDAGQALLLGVGLLMFVALLWRFRGPLLLVELFAAVAPRLGRRNRQQASA